MRANLEIIVTYTSTCIIVILEDTVLNTTRDLSTHQISVCNLMDEMRIKEDMRLRGWIAFGFLIKPSEFFKTNPSLVI